MQHGSDFQRGYQAALADAKGGWARCWMQERQLADDAVYGPFGLTEEQQGYKAGLDECFPGGVSTAPGYMAKPLPVFGFVYAPKVPRAPKAAVQHRAEVPVVAAKKPCEGPCQKLAPAPGLGVVGEDKKELTEAEKRRFMARLV